VIDAVLFDLDETLLDRSTSLRAFLADQFGRHIDDLGTVSLDEWRDRFLVLDQRGLVHKSVVYPAILAEFGGLASAADGLLADYRSRCSRFAQPFAGMAVLLGEMRRQGLSIGIVTNGETDFQTRNIEALGLNTLVDAILISEREGLRKPAAELFHRAAAALGAPPERCLFVGDNPVTDILGAAATGMKTAWLRGSADWPLDRPANPGATIDQVGDILGLIDLQARAADKDHFTS
jgi:putative hydrolase of the HAD superfamily